MQEHINEFGIGMLLFANMVKHLEGDYFINKQMEDGTKTEDDTYTHVRIGFKLPFTQAMDGEIQNDLYKIH